MRLYGVQYAVQGELEEKLPSAMSVLRVPRDATTTPRIEKTAEPVTPIKAWACIGALITAFILYVWIRWLAGPFATPVDKGPSLLPAWMSVDLVVSQVVVTAGMCGFFYWFLIRPWWRERRLSSDGLLCVAGLLLWFQDGMTNYATPWITYNSHLVNIGSWYNDVPGWMSFGRPGRQLLEPVLLMPGTYTMVFLIVPALGCWIMRRTKARWPQFGPYRLIGICLLALAVYDIVSEGLIFMPLGWFTYAGGPFPILFPSTYHTFPLSEPICGSLLFTGVTALRYYKDDQGRMLVERGVDRVRGPFRQGVYRLLAIIAASQLLFLVCYTIPVGLLMAAHPRQWPADAQKRSYLTDFICGAGTDRACPGPAIPLSRGEHSARVSPAGTLVVPGGTRLPKPVPFTR
jgi:Spirocyclase AveC-like